MLSRARTAHGRRTDGYLQWDRLPNKFRFPLPWQPSSEIHFIPERTRSVGCKGKGNIGQNLGSLDSRLRGNAAEPLRRGASPLTFPNGSPCRTAGGPSGRRRRRRGSLPGGGGCAVPLTTNRYQAGYVNCLSVVTVQTSVRPNERTAMGLLSEGRRPGRRPTAGSPGRASTPGAGQFRVREGCPAARGENATPCRIALVRCNTSWQDARRAWRRSALARYGGVEAKNLYPQSLAHPARSSGAS